RLRFYKSRSLRGKEEEPWDGSFIWVVRNREGEWPVLEGWAEGVDNQRVGAAGSDSGTRGRGRVCDAMQMELDPGRDIGEEGDVTWPVATKQFYNEKLVTEVLEIGVGVRARKWVRESGDEGVTAEGIEMAVRKVIAMMMILL
ncbi:UDP-glycosyltransferase 73B3, partial [Linum perenne]